MPEQPGRIDELEHELQFTKESLQATIEELETSNEELESANEELQSTNEELQATNEELETSKEEMQSLNEELSTVNAELQAKVNELSRATDNMHNLLNSTHVAAVFLDSQFNVKWYTDQAKELFNLIPTDIGRPLGHLTSNLEFPRAVGRLPRGAPLAGAEGGRGPRQQGGLAHDVDHALPHRREHDRRRGGHLRQHRPHQAGGRGGRGHQADFDNMVQDRPRAAGHARPTIAGRLGQRAVLPRQRGRTGGDRRPDDLQEAGRRRWDTPAMRRLLDNLARGPGNLADFRLTDGSGGPAGSVLVANARRLDAGPESMKMIVLSLTEATQEKTGSGSADQ